MKILLILISLIAFTSIAFCQSKEMFLDVQLDKIKTDKDKVICVGMTPSEVKAKIGNPKAVEGGFPQITGTVMIDSPKMVGQMNNSTWYYFLNPQVIRYFKDTKFKSELNPQPKQNQDV